MKRPYSGESVEPAQPAPDAIAINVNGMAPRVGRFAAPQRRSPISSQRTRPMRSSTWRRRRCPPARRGWSPEHSETLRDEFLRDRLAGKQPATRGSRRTERTLSLQAGLPLIARRGL